MAERNWCNLKIFLTGDKGFLGRNIQESLSIDGNTIIGLEAESRFDRWLNNLENLFVDIKLDAVIHAGAMASNQSVDPSIFLWNSYATLALAQCVRNKFGTEIPFIFFSSFQANVVENKPENASWYGWSKKYAEDCLIEVIPSATIFRPSVMWGDERYKKDLAKTGSVPFQLASHQLRFLYSDWGRDYVHVSDVISAIKISLCDKPVGCFSLCGEYWWNKDLAKLTDWCGYDIIDHHIESDKRHFSSNILPDDVKGLTQIPKWKIISSLRDEFQKIEDKYNESNSR